MVRPGAPGAPAIRGEAARGEPNFLSYLYRESRTQAGTFGELAAYRGEKAVVPACTGVLASLKRPHFWAMVGHLALTAFGALRISRY